MDFLWTLNDDDCSDLIDIDNESWILPPDADVLSDTFVGDWWLVYKKKIEEIMCDEVRTTDVAGMIVILVLKSMKNII